MSLAISKTRCTIGIKSHSVSVEVHLSNGLPGFTIVGLAETAVKESKDRVRSAIINSHFEFPCRRITVNLAPADLPKTGAGFDLPIALGILAASGQIPALALSDHEFIGELALNGHLRGTPAIIPALIAAQIAEQYIIVPTGNSGEATLVGYEKTWIADSLIAVCNYLCQNTPLTSIGPSIANLIQDDTLDWSDIKGQIHAKLAMQVAACGGHSILLSGPPGSGKTMLSQRFIGLLPHLSKSQALEVAAIHSLRNAKVSFEQCLLPPLRTPHHTASPAALVGGGNPPKPGEISLAHCGVLFLDELPEFNRSVLETLREPLESGKICISRAAMQTEFPARFQLIAAMNPCPCGQYGNPHTECSCTPDQITRYLNKLSTPFLDRIDMQVTVHHVPHAELITKNQNESGESLRIRQQVKDLREFQLKRQGVLNAELSVKECERICDLSTEHYTFLSEVLTRLKLSARSFHRLLKVARTLADMEQSTGVSVVHLQRALSFKQTLRTR